VWFIHPSRIRYTGENKHARRWVVVSGDLGNRRATNQDVIVVCTESWQPDQERKSLPLSPFVSRAEFRSILDDDCFISCAKICTVQKEHLLSRAAYQTKMMSEKNSHDKQPVGVFPTPVTEEIDSALRRIFDLKKSGSASNKA